jgi:hypothetical protein
MEDVGWSYACQRSPPRDDCTDHATGAARDELIAGFDHGIIEGCRK